MHAQNPNNSHLTSLYSVPSPVNNQPSPTGGMAVSPTVVVSNTTVYNTTGPPIQPKVTGQKWSTGLFGCFSDIPNYCMTCWFPCVTFGQIAEIVDRGATSCGTSAIIYLGICHFFCCVWVYTFFYRTKMRKQYNLPQSPCPDCIAHCLCHKHALCQEYRELKNRGFDMSIGWQANVERMNAGVMMVPVIVGGMTR